MTFNFLPLQGSDPFCPDPLFLFFLLIFFKTMYVMNFNLDDNIVLGTFSSHKTMGPEALFFTNVSVLFLE